jgi:RimJ/RimL family protein N-acetyltransferase
MPAPSALDDPTPTIETARLRLLPLRVADAEEMAIALSDPRLYEFIGGAPPTPSELRKTYARWIAGPPRATEAWHNWAVRLVADGTLIGHVQSTVLDAGTLADVAWIFGTPWHGHGYATEAATGMLDWLDSAGVQTLTAHVHPRHGASALVAERAGLAATDEVEGGEAIWRRGPARSP